MSTSAAALLLAYSAVEHPHRPAAALIWVLLALVVAGNGCCIPGTTALAQEAGRRSGGAASALQGGLTFTVGALATPLTGLTGHQTVLVLAVLMTAFYSCAVALLALSGGWRS
jgi:MFS transporter, DHA1 family, multidrug resistance protein